MFHSTGGGGLGLADELGLILAEELELGLRLADADALGDIEAEGLIEADGLTDADALALGLRLALGEIMV